MNTIINYIEKSGGVLFLLLLFLLSFSACDEGKRFEINSDDATPPNPPVFTHFEPLSGGAKIFYKIPADEDLLSVDAQYTNEKGKTFHFSASYFMDHVEVFGFAEEKDYTVQLFSVDRAGNRSEALDVSVKPSSSLIQNVFETVEVIASFNSIVIQWQDALKQTINIYVDYTVGENTLTKVFTSNLESEKRVIGDLPGDHPTNVKIRVGDRYENMTASKDFGEVIPLLDFEIPKTNWALPNDKDSVAGVPQVYGNKAVVIDGIIDFADNWNYLNTYPYGRTGKQEDGNCPWNFIVRLDDYYELSRITTWQRHSDPDPVGASSKGAYYKSTSPSVSRYNMYYLDEETNQWVFISYHEIPVPVGKSDMDIITMGKNGDAADMYPAPGFTKATRWFRFEALGSFADRSQAYCLSELTLFGRKATK
ncbi:hypothetical protein AGMMS50262_09740 [Bacteroidia bacterium]|nr:hypothetical protein AGMMS50262_09740 [Bacteroidia bacterium]